MKFKFLKAAIAGFVISVSGGANAGLIDSSNWTISNIEGVYSKAYTDWATISGIDPSKIETFLSDFVLFCAQQTTVCAFNAMSGYPQYGYPEANHSITIDFNTDYSFTDVDFFSSRSNDKIISVEFFNDGTLISDITFTPGASGWTGIDINFVADQIVFDFEAVKPGSQLILHEVRFIGDMFVVPEPSTIAIFALGIMGLASRRFKKQS